MLEWNNRIDMRCLCIAPSMPTGYAFVESFSDRFRDECLNEAISSSHAEARYHRNIEIDGMNVL